MKNNTNHIDFETELEAYYEEVMEDQGESNKPVKAPLSSNPRNTDYTIEAGLM